MFILNKINQLQHLPFLYRVRLLLFQLKKTLKLSYAERDQRLNSFLTTHLLRYNGFLIKEDDKSYTTDFVPANTARYRITLRKPPSSDFPVYDQVFVFKEYQPLVELIKKNNGVAGTGSLNIIDAGGNIGCTSVFFNSIFPGARFGVVEPADENFKVLQKNIEQNKFKSARLFNGGVWDFDTDLEVKRDFRDGNDWSVRVVPSDKPTGLKGFSIPTLMEELNFDVIDILKIDIEGSEKQLFSDPERSARFLSKTKYIAIEIHDELDCRDEINDRLRSNDFEFFFADGLTIGFNRKLVSVGN